MVEAVTFAQLVETANRRLFKLREHVQERYPESGTELVERIEGDKKVAEQLGLPLRPKAEGNSRVVPSVPKPDKYKKAVPVYDLAVAAGKFSASQSPEAIGWMYVECSRPLDKLMFVARVVGKSMEQAIPSGSWAVFRLFSEAPSPTAIDGKRVIVQLRETDPDTGGQYTLKRWHVTRRGDDGTVEQVELRSENADFKAIVLSAKDAEIRAVAEFLELVSP
jgi:SOS-response transcriptional repressor LexA